MDHIILGLLILRSRSIYDLQQCMEAGLNLMYSNSLGSIQAALKKLLNAGFATVAEEAQGKRIKRVYSITDSGRSAFSAWVSTPIDGATAKNPELGKLYFMGFSDPETRRVNLLKTIEKLKEPYAVLSAIVEEGEHMEVPREFREILHYQVSSARFGRDFLKFQIDWFENFLKEEEKQL